MAAASILTMASGLLLSATGGAIAFSSEDLMHQAMLVWWVWALCPFGGVVFACGMGYGFERIGSKRTHANIRILCAFMVGMAGSRLVYHMAPASFKWLIFDPFLLAGMGWLFGLIGWVGALALMKKITVKVPEVVDREIDKADEKFIKRGE
jgi:hypothetical protein